MNFYLSMLWLLMKIFLGMVALSFFMMFVMMVLYVLRNDADLPMPPFTEEEEKAQIKAIEDAIRKREERNARKVRRKLQPGADPENSNDQAVSQPDDGLSDLQEGNPEGGVLSGQDQEGPEEAVQGSVRPEDLPGDVFGGRDA